MRRLKLRNGNSFPHFMNSRPTRRSLLRIGALAPMAINLIDWFRGRADGIETAKQRANACILIWLDGGPSHLETFDPKPEAPSEVRGPFASIATSVSGVRISELLPMTAQVMDKLALIRSLTSPLGEHGLAHHYLLTGYKPSPVLDYPSIGSVVSYMRQQSLPLPSYVAIPEIRGGGAGFLGPHYDPFATGGDPSHNDFRVPDLDFFPGVDAQRIARRREFLTRFDQGEGALESNTTTSDPHFEQAYRLITSESAKQAFQLTTETSKTRERYGIHALGQSCLLARRLVERGVPFATVSNPGWDTHENLVVQLRDGYTGAKDRVGLIPKFDRSFSALIEDLDQRGLLTETLVIAMGEFGRTPKLNPRGGRDHWPRVFSAVVAGGGISGGQVIGSSDRVGESPHDRPVTPSDLVRTIYALLDIDPETMLRTADGRPIRINQEGRLIRELT